MYHDRFPALVGIFGRRGGPRLPWVLVLGLGLSLIASACGGASDATAPNPTAPSPHPSFSSVAYSPEYTWHQGDAPVDMGSTRGRVCVLTRLSGDFNGGGEFVEIVQKTGHWYLQGGSLQNGVTGTARCLAVSSYGGEYSAYTQDNAHWTIQLDPLPAICGLTRITGDFTGEAPTGAAIKGTLNGGWQLTVATEGTYASANARCFKGSFADHGYWKFSSLDGTYAKMKPLKSDFCFLTEIMGRFEGGGEWVHVFADPDGFWWLGGDSLQDDDFQDLDGVFAAAHCVG